MIRAIATRDARFPFKFGSASGSDAIHRDPVYSYAVLLLKDDGGRTGTGLAFTLGVGTELVCQAAEFYAQHLINRDIEEIMRDFGSVQRSMADEQHFRWLGPHKGVVHLALAAVTNACWDLWAKSRGVPLWQLLLELTPQELVATLDLSYVEDELTAEQARTLLETAAITRPTRATILKAGYPGYDTSVGWFNYSDRELQDNCKRSLEAGFTAMKLKVGSADPARDIRRANIVRNIVGPTARVMIDANQQWALPQALHICGRLAEIDPYWIEEPTHPDDVLAHRTISAAIAPVKLAAGEHVPNRVVFKNYLQLNCVGFIQVDTVRVAGVSEFIAVSMLAKKFGIPVVPHVGDMGQIHQHLVLFNHIALDLPVVFLEHIPHLKNYFINSACIMNGVYSTPQDPGASSDLI